MPICTNPECETVVPQARVDAGYEICIECSEKSTAKTQAHMLLDEDGNAQLARTFKRIREYEPEKKPFKTSEEVSGIDFDDINRYKYD